MLLIGHHVLLQVGQAWVLLLLQMLSLLSTQLHLYLQFCLHLLQLPHVLGQLLLDMLLLQQCSREIHVVIGQPDETTLLLCQPILEPMLLLEHENDGGAAFVHSLQHFFALFFFFFGVLRCQPPTPVPAAVPPAPGSQLLIFLHLGVLLSC
jgi:hypothetical protein